MHRNLSIFHDFSSLFTTSAAVGHLRWHIPQNMHFEISMEILPLALPDNIFGPKGYLTVAGFLNKLFKTVFAITKKHMFTSQRSLCTDRLSGPAQAHPQGWIREAFLPNLVYSRMWESLPSSAVKIWSRLPWRNK